ncbi:hypothetical protein Vadar_031595 [Vaccinium darrowii]|uniref:Uncharacterized protein n=1 Tax=Vaccinium darrowii TaxID=229202 RepID=A0ACB7X5L3_9ERIC|nr:hypothetical protein Vadar_031595 [Vaccinium darrowii]
MLSPINGRDLWPETNNPVMLPPNVKKRSGRPKKARRREPEEPPRSHKIDQEGGLNEKSHVDASTSATSAPSVALDSTAAPIANPVAPTNGNTTMVRSPALAPDQPPMASQESMASSALTMVNRTTLESSGKLVWRGRIVRLASSFKKTPK